MPKPGEPGGKAEHGRHQLGKPEDLPEAPGDDLRQRGEAGLAPELGGETGGAPQRPKGVAGHEQVAQGP
ncbi:MAG: hypothetical protein M3133_05805 [Actinomycetota bacterium]|nr:hypothetical protein [Actinomycetota bacterium]